MKSFFSGLLGSCLGVFVAFIVLFLIIIGIGAAGIASKETKKNAHVLKLKLEDFIPEKSGNVSQDLFFLSGNPEMIGLKRILELLDAAATDDNIKGIYIENNTVNAGQATVLSLMQGLRKFKESGKFIYSYADSHSQMSYLLCSVADSMFLNPLGSVDLKGFGATIPFFKNMLDKVGVEMNIFYAGNFKSATEPFRLTEMSEFNRLQTREFLRDMYQIMANELSQNRGLELTTIDSIMTHMAGRKAKDALQSGLVDVLFYEDQVDDFLKKKLGVEEDKKLTYITLADYDTTAKVHEDTGGRDKIAIVHAEGEIMYGVDEPGVISEKNYMTLLTKIRNDKKIKAVVLRVNSPGGNAFSSDVIWRELERIKEAGKPVIASFGDYAASGGYYIAAGADQIVAQPNTLTGSIGVFMMFPDATKLLNDKIGVNFDTIKTHEFATGFSPTNKLSEKEKGLLQEMTLETYDLFLNRVSTGRKLSIDSTKMIAQGRVWTGKKALEIGLVDTLGDLDDAIAIAAKKAGLEKYKIVEYPYIEEDIMATIIREIQKSKGGEEDAVKMLAGKEEFKWINQYRQFKSIIRCREPHARLPFILSLN